MKEKKSDKIGQVMKGGRERERDEVPINQMWQGSRFSTFVGVTHSSAVTLSSN